MKRPEGETLRWHPGISMHKIPVAGVGGAICAIGFVVMGLVGLPIAKWFLAGSVLLGLGVVGILGLWRKLRPRTEVEEVRLNLEATERPIKPLSSDKQEEGWPLIKT